MEWFAVAGSALALGFWSASCTDDEPQPPVPAPACANVAPSSSSAACPPRYAPSVANVFANTLKPTCAKSGVSCHASTGRQGGLTFEDPDEAYRQMLETTQVARPSSPSCSPLVGRIAALDGNVRMPPGRSLDANEQCSIIQWIANGAKR